MDKNAKISIAGHRGLVVGGIHATREVLISVYEGFPQRAFPQ